MSYLLHTDKIVSHSKLLIGIITLHNVVNEDILTLLPSPPRPCKTPPHTVRHKKNSPSNMLRGPELAAPARDAGDIGTRAASKSMLLTDAV